MSASSSLSVFLVGATGLTGSATFESILSSPAFASFTTLTRRPLEAPSTKLPSVTYTNKVVEFDKPETWSLKDAADGSAAGKTFVSCLGTTFAQAGSVEAQRKIDLDLNLSLAKAAKEAGIDTYILVSSGGASATSYSPYLKMKGTLEDGVQQIGFKSVYILQPGLLVGKREEKRTMEGLTQVLFKGLRSVGLPMKSLMVDAEDVGRAISKIAVEPKDGVHYVNNSAILALAKTVGA